MNKQTTKEAKETATSEPGMKELVEVLTSIEKDLFFICNRMDASTDRLESISSTMSRVTCDENRLISSVNVHVRGSIIGTYDAN